MMYKKGAVRRKPLTKHEMSTYLAETKPSVQDGDSTFKQAYDAYMAATHAVLYRLVDAYTHPDYEDERA